MRFLLFLALIFAGAFPAWADEDAALRRLLSLLSKAQIGDSYETIKKLAPEIGALHPDTGDDNTEALIQAKTGKIVLRGEFNFSKNRLVSHGFTTGELTHSAAHGLLLRCVAILEQLHGESERHIVLPSESDGPRDELGMSFNWHKDKTSLGLDFHYRSGFATVSWGAQAE